METDTKTKRSPASVFFRVFGRTADAVLGKFLYFAIAAELFFCTMSLWTSEEIGYIIYFTVPDSLIGKRPSRLFSLLTHADMSIPVVRAIFFAITLITTLFAAFALYLFIKDIKAGRNKLLVMLGIGVLIQMTLDGYKYMMWDYVSISLYIAMMLVCYAAYFLLKTDKRYIAVIFAAAAEAIDCRAVLFLFPVTLTVIFVKAVHKENKQLKLMNMLCLAAASAVLVVSFTSVDFGFNADSDTIDEMFVQRFLEIGTPEEKIDKAIYGFKFEPYLRVTPNELVGDSFTNCYYVKDIVYEDHFQLLLLLFAGLIILYDHKDDTSEASDNDTKTAVPAAAE
ncbi:MAG: hypothetical protein II664_06675, partial [Oscillospiraceae bacterium]|nr:hypothetical protein [Oscillospiraceae bacterium]